MHNEAGIAAGHLVGEWQAAELVCKRIPYFGGDAVLSDVHWLNRLIACSAEDEGPEIALKFGKNYILEQVFLSRLVVRILSLHIKTM